jgi:NhaA family Na+:H+ antiporter
MNPPFTPPFTPDGQQRSLGGDGLKGEGDAQARQLAQCLDRYGDNGVIFEADWLCTVLIEEEGLDESRLDSIRKRFKVWDDKDRDTEHGVSVPILTAILEERDIWYQEKVAQAERDAAAGDAMPRVKPEAGIVHLDNEQLDVDQDDPAYSFIGFIAWMQENSVPLIAGVIVALIISNVANESYNYYFGSGNPKFNDCSNGTSSEHRLLGSSETDPCSAEAEHHRRLTGGENYDVFVVLDGCFTFFGHLPTLRFLSNDIVICFFFGIATKEITESLLPGGSLNPPSKAATPLIATLGGVFGPLAVFFTLVPIFYQLDMFDQTHEMALLHNGWGIVTATDIALAWVVAKRVFGRGHPAIDFLLLLAIADDGLGLIIVAIFYGDPDLPAQPQWLLLNVLAMGIAYLLRKWYYRHPKGKRVSQSWSTYILICGPISWVGLMKAHLHPALALCFVVPFMPGPDHENLDVLDHPDGEAEGGNVEGEEVEFKKPKKRSSMIVQEEGRAMEFQAGMYSGLLGHHIARDLLVTEIDDVTGEAHSHGSCLDLFEHDCKLFVDVSLGFFALTNAGVELKTFGGMAWTIYLSLLFGKVLGIVVCAKFGQFLGFPLPAGLGLRHLFMVGLIASIGLTVALFVTDAAFEDEGLKGEAKMGALCSALNGIIALVLSQVFDFSEIDARAPLLEEVPPEKSRAQKSNSEEASEDVAIGTEGKVMV